METAAASYVDSIGPLPYHDYLHWLDDPRRLWDAMWAQDSVTDTNAVDSTVPQEGVPSSDTRVPSYRCLSHLIEMVKGAVVIASEAKMEIKNIHKEIKDLREYIDGYITRNILEALKVSWGGALDEIASMKQTNATLRREMDALKTYVSNYTNRNENVAPHSVLTPVVVSPPQRNSGAEHWIPEFLNVRNMFGNSSATSSGFHNHPVHLNPGHSHFHRSRRVRSISGDNELNEFGSSSLENMNNLSSLPAPYYRSHNRERVHSSIDIEFPIQKGGANAEANSLAFSPLVGSSYRRNRKNSSPNYSEEASFFESVGGHNSSVANAHRRGTKPILASYESQDAAATFNSPQYDEYTQKDIGDVVSSILKLNANISAATTNAPNVSFSHSFGLDLVPSPQKHSNFASPMTLSSQRNPNEVHTTSMPYPATLWSRNPMYEAVAEQQHLAKADAPLALAENKFSIPFDPREGVGKELIAATDLGRNSFTAGTYAGYSEDQSTFSKAALQKKNEDGTGANCESGEQEDATQNQKSYAAATEGATEGIPQQLNRFNKHIVAMTCATNPDYVLQSPSNDEYLQGLLLRIEWRITNVSVLASFLQPTESLVSSFDSECELRNIYLKLVVQNPPVNTSEWAACSYGLHISVTAPLSVTYVLQCGKERKPPKTHDFNASEWDGYDNFASFEDVTDLSQDTMCIVLEVLEFSSDK